MQATKIFILYFFGVFFLSTSISLSAQIDSVKIDTIKIKSKEHSDFRKFYERILFKKKKNSFPIQPNYRKEDLFEGKIIRNIHYKTQDPFGYSLNDTTQKPQKWIERAGNTLHGKSKPFVLRQNVLFKSGDRYDSVKVSDLIYAELVKTASSNCGFFSIFTIILSVTSNPESFLMF